jgi:TonB family protein
MNSIYHKLTLILLVLANSCFAQKVTNISAEQVGQTIQVSYNLETQSPCTISLFYSTDNGASWQGPLKKVSGDIGEKVTSGSKKITWDVLNELEQLKFSSVVFKVDAINYVEEMAKFPGGESEMYKFIGRNIRYPQMAVDAGITGKVFVSFVVDENGYVTDVKVLRGIGGGCDEEAIRTIKAMPKWIPGTQNGKPVCVSLNLPISFTLNNNKSINDKLSEEVAFFEANKKHEGVVTTASGLQYKVIKMGTGRKPTINDKITAHYHGTLIDGTVFDSSIERGKPVSFPVNGVIQGWVEALQIMPIGSKWMLYLPSNLAYGEKGAGGKIGPNTPLIFEVELISIDK